MHWNELVRVRPEIEALIAEFAYLIDHGRGTEVHELFTEDGIYGRSTGERATGREAVRRTYERRAQLPPYTTRHLFTNLRLEADVDGALKGTCMLTLYMGEGELPLPPHPYLVSEYRDNYRLCDDGRWRFAERITTWLFAPAGAKTGLKLGGSESD